MRRREFLTLIGAGAAAGFFEKNSFSAEEGKASARKPNGVSRPNIVFILADDLGYGDVHCMDPEHGKIPTPHCDQLAKEGMRFTDAHSTAAVCSPSRYSLLTGRYNWRSYLQHDVTMGTAPPMINKGRMTVASLLKQYDYKTAVIGKWHLGLNYDVRTKTDAKTETNHTRLKTGAITGGPLDLGFDYCYCYLHGLFGFPIPTDYAMLENNMIDLPTPDRKWDMAALAPNIVKRSCAWIEQNKKDPFFIYVALNTPHIPLAPTAEFRGKSGCGPYGDFVMETDWAVGEILKQLDANGLAENTLVIFSSDNGCAPPFFGQLAAKGHFSNGIYRGGKGDAWDGGHREPFIVRWPQVVKAGTQCDQLIGQNDFLATVADLMGAKIPSNAAEDSISFLPLLKGGKEPTRTSLIHHSRFGQFAITEGNWKLILCPNSGGVGKLTDEEIAAHAPVQLYDMTQDASERTNLWKKRPEIVERLTQLVKKSVNDGRTTPGPIQKNDVEVDIYKLARYKEFLKGKENEEDTGQQ